MDYLISFLTVTFAFATVLSRKRVTASFFFLMTCLSVSAIFFELQLVPFSLILIFSSAFWLNVYFLFSTLLSKEMKAKSLFPDKIRLSIACAGVSLISLFFVLYYLAIKDTTPTAYRFIDFAKFWKEDFILNYPILLTFFLLLILGLIAVLYMTWNGHIKEQDHDNF